MKKDNSNEIFPIVDKEGNTIGSATRGECHNGSKLLHPVVHLHIFDNEGRLFLQQRPLWKEIQPGKWDTAVGGHVDYGEEIATALTREAHEEVGIEGFTPIFMMKYLFESERENELVHVYMTTHDGEVMPSDELDGGRFWTIGEIDNAIGKGVLTPNFELEYRMLRQLPGFPPTNDKKS
ncbi:MAG: NUDIX domain-containing protein [Bacteroidales bacterium]|nr:NUDIX domain-containing protein [Bacteroidales bacterium]